MLVLLLGYDYSKSKVSALESVRTLRHMGYDILDWTNVARTLTSGFLLLAE